MTSTVRKVSVYDYPEHLNPFYEDDNHKKIRFWTLKKSDVRDSLRLSNLKDMRNSWTLKSFMKKGKKSSDWNLNASLPPRIESKEPSPVEFRRALQYSSMSRSTIGPDRYVYGGSVTPLPRSRFQERMRSTSQMEVNGTSHGSPPGRASFSYRSGGPYAQSETNGSMLSIESTNPFECNTPVRASRRKKKRAPLPPTMNGIPKAITENTISTTAVKENDQANKEDDIALDDPKLEIELKIVEDEDKTVAQALERQENNTEESDAKPSDINETKSTEKIEPLTETAQHTETTEKLISSEIKVEEKIFNGKNHEEAKHLEIITPYLAICPAKPFTPKEDNEDIVNNNQTAIETVEEKNNISDPEEESIDDERKRFLEEQMAKGNIKLIKLKVEEEGSTDDKEDSNNNDIMFKKVDIVSYRRNSCCTDNILFRPEKDKNVTFFNQRSVSMNNNFVSAEIKLFIDEEANHVDDEKEEPQKVVCKLYENGTHRKPSADNSISSTEREFMEIDKTTKELELEISKLHSAKKPQENGKPPRANGHSVASIRQMFDNAAESMNANPIPKPRRAKLEYPLRFKK